ncbi:MAG: hypothetical protein R2706_10900 [Acidimicrobiales bacterium]
MTEPIEAPSRLSVAAKSDIRAASGVRVLAVIVMLAWLAYQWGFGNDATLPTLVARATLAVDDGETARAGSLAVATGFGVGFLFTLVTQVIDVSIVILGFNQLPLTSAWISRSVRRRGWVKPFADMTWVGRWMLAYGVGTSAVLLVDRFARNKTATDDQNRIVGISLALSSISVGLVSALVVAVAVLALRFPQTERAGEIVIRVASNPLTWLGLFGSIYLISHLRTRGNDNEVTDLADHRSGQRDTGTGRPRSA